MHYRSFISAILLVVASIQAQAQFTMQGRIEYERKVNLLRQYDDEDNEWFQRVKSELPKFRISYFNLYFNMDKTVYKPGRELPDAKPNVMFGGTPAADNVVLTDMKLNHVQASKQVFEQKFLVEDSTRKMKWKITDEIRTIANYKCRKAVGRICDSVYVVAFYTDDIPVSGGPEMFGGLPGMIIELAIPRLYCTWTATVVEQTTPKSDDFSAALKGKHITQKELDDKLKESMKDWGKYGARNIWWCTL